MTISVPHKLSVVKLFVFFLVMVFISGCGGGGGGGGPGGDGGGGSGYIKHTIISPLNTKLHEKEASYDSGIRSSPTKVKIHSNYEDFHADFGYPQPYCQWGGPYTIKAENDPSPGAGKQTAETTLYYCKTAKDLIQDIRIPGGWKNDNLTLYCNDGSLAFKEEFNFEVFTSQISTYKACILRNEEKEEKNVILYGYEVGHPVVDSDEEYKFDFESFNSQATKDLELVSEDSTDTETGYVNEEVSVPMKQVCVNWGYPPTTGRGPSATEQECMEWEFQPRSKSEAKDYLTGSVEEEEESDEPTLPTYTSGRGAPTTDTEEEPPVRLFLDRPIYGSYTDGITVLERKSDVKAGVHESVFLVKVPKESQKGEYTYEDKEGNQFKFSYREKDRFFSLTRYGGNLNTPISSVFTIPGDFDLSRVALFRSLSGGKKVYGYEKSASLMFDDGITDRNPTPVYKLRIEGPGFGFSQDDCFNQLGRYGAEKANTISPGKEIVCTPNNRVLINAKKVDSSYGEQTGFGVFKNVALDLN